MYDFLYPDSAAVIAQFTLVYSVTFYKYSDPFFSFLRCPDGSLFDLHTLCVEMVSIFFFYVVVHFFLFILFASLLRQTFRVPLQTLCVELTLILFWFSEPTPEYAVLNSIPYEL